MTLYDKFLIIAVMLAASVLSFAAGVRASYDDIIASKGFVSGGKTYTCTTFQ